MLYGYTQLFHIDIVQIIKIYIVFKSLKSLTRNKNIYIFIDKPLTAQNVYTIT